MKWSKLLNSSRRKDKEKNPGSKSPTSLPVGKRLNETLTAYSSQRQPVV